MDWKQEGQSKITPEQRRMLNAICACLADQLKWHGVKLSKDDYRHLICAVILGWRMIPGVDTGNGHAGFVMLGGSSKDLTKSQASEAITMAVHIGDCPTEQGLDAKPIRWSDTVLIGLGHSPTDFR